MTATVPATVGFLQHLRGDAPFVLRRGTPGPEWQDEAVHTAAYRHNPARYALCALADRVHPAQQARVLFQVLRASREGLTDEARQTLDRVDRVLLRRLGPDQVLKVFLALRRVRANHKHTSRAILSYLLEHPRLEEMAARRRPALVDCVEHALGRDVARGCARFLRENGTTDAYVRRNLLRFGPDAERIAAVMGYLYGQGPCPVPRTTEGSFSAAASVSAAPERPRTITATNRGDISATLVHTYRGGTNTELKTALERYVVEAAQGMPYFDGTVAMVLDASASTLSYGERQFCCIAQSQAFRLVLQRCCARLNVHVVGRDGELPRPEGDTDLATALLDALENDPDVAIVVSDGYENVQGGDLARVVASLPAAGVTTPVVYCHSKFTDKDDLSLRRPSPLLTELEFWHQDDFVDVLWSLFAHARAPRGEVFLEEQLRRKLAVLEQEGKPWTLN